MILTPAPLQPTTSRMALAPAQRSSVLGQARRNATLRSVLQTARVPQQLCLDLQPRPR
jgi:hypothetical protein